MKLIYDVEDKPKFGALLVFALQQLLAIMTATLVVPVVVNQSVENANMSSAAALFGAGVGTLVYVLFTKKKSPVFLGSSFAFIGSMIAAFTGGVSISLGFLGMVLGALFAGLVYVAIAIIVKLAGVEWINRVMPVTVIGPVVSIIGLSLAGNAVGDMTKGSIPNVSASPLVTVLCGVITLIITVVSSSYGKKIGKLIPFIFGILGGYLAAAVFTLIGTSTGIEAFQVLNVEPFKALVADGITLKTFVSVPDFTFLTAVKGIGELNGAYVSTIAVAYVPVAFVVFAEHIADHKNISSIIERDLLVEPGLSRTLLGDGVGSLVGALFGGCPNTTYGESIGCVAITKNASVATIIAAAVLSMVISFISPFIAFVNSIPSCVMGGVCMALYGFIAVSGLKMVQQVDLNKNKNLFVVSTILISGIGGLTLQIGKVTITSVACALILGIIINLVLSKANDND